MDSWATSYRVWAQVHEREEDIWRAVVKEKMAQAIDRMGGWKLTPKDPAE